MKLAVLGSSGRTGRAVVERALSLGCEVNAQVRSADRLKLSRPGLAIVSGSPTDTAVLARLFEGCDGVISAIGPSPENPAICSQVTAAVLEVLGTRRYLVVSGAGVDVPGDQKRFQDLLISRLVRLLARKAFDDKVSEYQLLINSAAAFVVVRAPRLVDGPAMGSARASLEHPLSSSLRRADLASFLVETAQNDAFTRQAPFVSV